MNGPFSIWNPHEEWVLTPYCRFIAAVLGLPAIWLNIQR